MTLAISILSFVAAALVVLALGHGLSQAWRAVSAEAAERPRADTRGPNRWVAGTCRGLAAMHHGSGMQAFGEELDRRLTQAGRPLGAMTGLEFLALSELIGAGLFLVTLAIIAAVSGIGLGGIGLALLVAVLAAWMTHAWLNGEVEMRRSRILLQYPFFLDLAVMTMEEGSSLSESLQIYCRDNPRDALAEEFRLVLQEMRLGKMAEEAFAGMIERVPADEVRQSLTAVMQAQRMDSPLGEVFREQAEGMRFKRSQMAERMAEELKVKVMGPVVLMMIAILILILGPAFLGIASSGIVS